MMLFLQTSLNDTRPQVTYRGSVGIGNRSGKHLLTLIIIMVINSIWCNLSIERPVVTSVNPCYSLVYSQLVNCKIEILVAIAL